MKKITVFLLVLVVISLFSLSAFAEDASELSVSSSASVSVTADRAELNIGCVSKDPSVITAQSDNAAVINKVLEALDKNGILKEDISTSEYSINENYEYKYDELGNGNRVLNGYEVIHMLKIIIRDIDKIGEIIDSAALAGANQSNGIRFFSSNEKEAYEKALAEAVKGARAKAEIMAQAADVSISGVKAITENGSAMEYYRNANFAMTASGKAEDSTVISSGSLNVSASVEIVYYIK